MKFKKTLFLSLLATLCIANIQASKESQNQRRALHSRKRAGEELTEQEAQKMNQLQRRRRLSTKRMERLQKNVHSEAHFHKRQKAMNKLGMVTTLKKVSEMDGHSEYKTISQIAGNLRSAQAIKRALVGVMDSEKREVLNVLHEHYDEFGQEVEYQARQKEDVAAE